MTALPGTTRDSLSELITLQGIPLLLTDTAGIRIAGDEIEHLGIQRTQQAIVDADLVILVLDGTGAFEAEDKEIFDGLTGRNRVIAINKSDSPSFKSANPHFVRELETISVSAATGDGFAQLRQAILAPFLSANGIDNGNLLITNARHYDLLRRAAQSLRSSSVLFEERASEELLLVGLHDALKYLGEITGEVTPEEILSEIFRTFCIGK